MFLPLLNPQGFISQQSLQHRSPTPPVISVEEMYRDAASVMMNSMPSLANDRTCAHRPCFMRKSGDLGLGESHCCLMWGCRDAKHTATLVQRYGCHALGIDPVDDHIVRAHALINEKNLQPLLTVNKGKIELFRLNSPTSSGAADANHAPDLHKGLQEWCFRCLVPRWSYAHYQTFATNLLEPAEAVRLYLPMSIVAANMATDYFEEIAQRVGFQIGEKDPVGSEWREYWQEDGTHNTSQKLLRLARLRRRRDAYIANGDPCMNELPTAIAVTRCWASYAPMSTF